MFNRFTLRRPFLCSMAATWLAGTVITETLGSMVIVERFRAKRWDSWRNEVIPGGPILARVSFEYNDRKYHYVGRTFLEAMSVAFDCVLTAGAFKVGCVVEG